MSHRRGSAIRDHRHRPRLRPVDAERQAGLGGDAKAREARAPRTRARAPALREQPHFERRRRGRRERRDCSCVVLACRRRCGCPARQRAVAFLDRPFVQVRKVLDRVGVERKRHGEDQLAAGLQQPARVDERARPPAARTCSKTSLATMKSLAAVAFDVGVGDVEARLGVEVRVHVVELGASGIAYASASESRCRATSLRARQVGQRASLAEQLADDEDARSRESARWSRRRAGRRLARRAPRAARGWRSPQRLQRNVDAASPAVAACSQDRRPLPPRRRRRRESRA